MGFLKEGFGDKQLRLLTFSWALSFWAFFHFTCDISNQTTDVHESIRAAATFFITCTGIYVFFITLFNSAERFVYCNFINGLLLIFGGLLYLVACFKDMDDEGTANNRGFQLLGHYMQPAIMTMFIGWDSIQIHHEYIKFSEFQIRILCYSLVLALSHLFLICYWYNQDQSLLSDAEKSYEAGQFFTFLAGIIIFIFLGVMNCTQWSKFKMVNLLCGTLLLLGGIIILISGCYLYICVGCSSFWCNGHSLAYYFFVFVFTMVIAIDINCTEFQT